MSHKVYLVERLMAASCYITLGWAGIVLLIAQALFKLQPTKFVSYHIFQAIFLFFAYYVISQLLGLVMVVISPIPIINNIPIILNSAIPMLAGFSIIEALVAVVLFYLIISSLFGKYSFLPWVSNIVKYWVR